MATNIDRIKSDLDRLVALGSLLDLSMVRSVVSEEEFEKLMNGVVPKDKLKAFIKKLPKFNASYEAWYSEALVLIKQVLPDRVANFVSLYEKPRGRKEVEYGNYVIQDYLQGLVVTQYGKTKVETSAAVPQFRQQLAILKAAEARFASSLFEIKQLVQADVFDRELGSARELLKNKFVRAAGAIAGVVLEKHLRQVCEDHGVKIAKKNAGISDLNELLKAGSIIEIPQWRHISMLGDIRNLCVHNKGSEPTSEQVKDLLDGTDKILKAVS
ncbi:hypothetical protein SAMN04488061_0960 [Filomicrobium insigne]|uniref:DUF4145 domain-containing protein n=1 Tax=Filomicrobium insigne TaxID=418854 RepID=A0A1H0IUB1_9HYPH|nr:hypothetical protein [Filomicrobium insigne]SDO34913.1 hypothetical protein SAMN04488061_0960 [Filomicrobium insigne]